MSQNIKKYVKVIVALFSIFVSTVCFSQSRFKYDTRGYLMDACEAVLDQRNSFEAGYCHGIYSAVLSGKLLRFGELGRNWCPQGDQTLDTKMHLGLVIKRIKDHPKQWNDGEAYYTFELALKEAFPCK